MMIRVSPLLRGIALSVLFACVSFCVATSHKANAATLPTPLTSTANSANLNPKVLQMALKAHAKVKSSYGLSTPNKLTIIDYSKPSNAKRLWVIDLNRNAVVFNTLVAHGQRSGLNQAVSFSDEVGSHKTSIGVFKTGSTYQGKHGTSLILHGLEKGINGNAFKRRVVIHSANYVNETFAKQHGRIGRSHGCPALSLKDTMPIINAIKNGSMVFSYFPDQNWMKKSRFIA